MDSEKFKHLRDTFKNIGNWRTLTQEEADQLLVYMTEKDKEGFRKWLAQEETAKALEQMNPEDLPPYIIKLLNEFREKE